jgi:NAD(P)-dependent dehydrogenase (short-subunit alcohol dehydrogenase family)
MPIVLVTGASRGLGLEFTRQYASDDFDVVACCRDPSKAKELQTLAEEQKNIHIETLEVTDAKSIKALADKYRTSTIDLLINNAGIYSGAQERRSAEDGDKSQDFGTINAEGWDKVLRTNLIAPIMVLQAFAPHLEKSKGPIAVMITSKMGSIAEMGSGYIAYRSSKAALNAAMVTVSRDLKEKNIIIVNLHPGWVKTDMGGPSAPLDAETSVTGMRNVIADLTMKKTGQFLSYDGKTIAW